ncbi:MAG TPA: ABC transporter ATP-binding protein [Streptosporangiaceae bacterium]|nr:ABC transporter ATP-binding protein [Streptosporangiaceae bacterium]
MNDGSREGSGAALGVVGDSLDVRGITVHFGGIVALDNVSLMARACEVTGIIGPNGAGKTTLLNVLCGFVRPEHGTMSFGGRELKRVRPHQLAKLGVARTLQGIGLFGGLSVIENVMVGATIQAKAGFWSGLLGLPRSDADERRLRAHAEQALELAGVGDHADAMPDTLAHGLRKRVVLARALVARPRLLLLDEPASGLADDELAELGEVITSLARTCTVVVIEHRMDLMMSVCKQIFVLDFGKVIAAGTPDQVQTDPAVTAAYLGTDITGEGGADDTAAEGSADDTAAEGGADNTAGRVGAADGPDVGGGDLDGAPVPDAKEQSGD